MKIITAPNPILYKVSSEIKKIDQKLINNINEMIDVLEKQNDPPGTGISAPQVGLSIQLFILKPNIKSTPQVFLNPKITEYINIKKKKSKKQKEIPLEGCLSVPKIWGEVKRFDKVLVEYETLSKEKKKEWFMGLNSTIVQHEIDHLNGILFTQRVLEQGGRLYEEKNGELIKKEI